MAAGAEALSEALKTVETKTNLVESKLEFFNTPGTIRCSSQWCSAGSRSTPFEERVQGPDA